MLGRAAKPKLVHLKSRRVTGAIVLTWDVRRARALRWRVLRSESGFAAGPFDDTVVGNGQTLVSDQGRPAPATTSTHRPRPPSTRSSVKTSGGRGTGRPG